MKLYNKILLQFQTLTPAQQMAAFIFILNTADRFQQEELEHYIINIKKILTK